MVHGSRPEHTRTRRGALVALAGLVLVACGGPARQPEVVRELLHRVPVGAPIAGLSEVLREGTDLVAGGHDASWQVAASPTEGVEGFRVAWSDAAWTVLQKVEEPDVADLAVREVPPHAALLAGDVLRGWAVHGPVSPGGELVAELFLVAPERMPLDTCVEVRAGSRLSDGPLLGGVVQLYPGVSKRPLVRHRLRVPIPRDAVLSSAEVALVDCGTGAELVASPVPIVAASDGLPSLEDLRARTGIPDAAASFAAGARAPAALMRTRTGVAPMAAPPLPRIKLGEAWPLLLTGAVDPSRWKPGDDPLAHVAQLLGSGTAVVPVDAPASRVGPWAIPTEPGPRLRRADPATLGLVRDAGAEAVVLGTAHAGDAGPEGLRATAWAAASQGLRVGGTDEEPIAWLAIPDGPLVAVVSARVARWDPTAQQRLSELAATARVHAATVVGVVDLGEGDRREVGRRLAADYDAVALLGPTLEAVEIVQGVPVIDGLPPLLDATGGTRPTVAVRLYVAPGEIRRIDLVALVSRGGRVERDRDKDSAGPWLEEVGARSLALGTDLRVGNSIAAVDAASHWPREPRVSGDGLVPEAVVWSAPPDGLPERCAGQAPTGPPSAVLGGVLEAWFTGPVPGEIGAGQPVRVAITWRARARLASGEVELAGVADGTSWRDVVVPCQGAWPFDRFEPGQVVRDELWLWPPDGADLPNEPVQLDLSAVVRVGGQVLRSASDARRLALGQVQVLPIR